MMLLKDEEIRRLPTYKKACWSWSYDGQRGSDDDLQRGEVEELLQEALEAQLKKVVAWGDEDCPHTDLYSPNLPKPFQHRKRRDCYECWQPLLNEVNEEVTKDNTHH